MSQKTLKFGSMIGTESRAKKLTDKCFSFIWSPVCCSWNLRPKSRMKVVRSMYVSITEITAQAPWAVTEIICKFPCHCYMHNICRRISRYQHFHSEPSYLSFGDFSSRLYEFCIPPFCDCTWYPPENENDVIIVVLPLSVWINLLTQLVVWLTTYLYNRLTTCALTRS